MKKEKLKPCPFCGGIPVIVSEMDHAIECDTCFANIPILWAEDLKELEINGQIARDAWNKRIKK